MITVDEPMTLGELLEWAQRVGGTLTLPRGTFRMNEPAPPGWTLRFTVPAEPKEDAT